MNVFSETCGELQRGRIFDCGELDASLIASLLYDERFKAVLAVLLLPE